MPCAAKPDASVLKCRSGVARLPELHGVDRVQAAARRQDGENARLRQQVDVAPSSNGGGVVRIHRVFQAGLVQRLP